MGFRRSLVAVFSILLLGSGCVSYQRQLKSNALDFLYPQGKEAAEATDVELHLPVRVGLAFAPSPRPGDDSFTESQRQTLLTQIADAFRDTEGVQNVQVIPTSYLSPAGSFDNLDRLAAAFGIDLVTLISYDQIQFSESGKSSIAYWTLVGSYVVKGEKNETRTMLDAVIYDIRSRALLFNASGESSLKGRSTPIEVSRALRQRSEQGFAEATDRLVANLQSALRQFADQASSGTVRGPGTPAIALFDAEGQPTRLDGGAGHAGPFEAVAALLLTVLLLCQRRRRGQTS